MTGPALTAAAKAFLRSPSFAVVGASPTRTKFGNKVLRWYLDHGLPVIPVHPTLKEIEGIPAVKSLSELPSPKDTSVSVVTPPAISASVLEEARKLGVPALWFQPGSEPAAGLADAKQAGTVVLAHGPCILRDTNDSLVNAARL